MLWTALLVSVICGVTGVLVDVDHPIAHCRGSRNGRFLHPLFLASASLVLLGSIAYLGGLLC